jgi:hypothetical protein
MGGMIVIGILGSAACSYDICSRTQEKGSWAEEVSPPWSTSPATRAERQDSEGRWISEEFGIEKWLKAVREGSGATNRMEDCVPCRVCGATAFVPVHVQAPMAVLWGGCQFGAHTPCSAVSCLLLASLWVSNSRRSLGHTREYELDKHGGASSL